MTLFTCNKCGFVGDINDFTFKSRCKPCHNKDVRDRRNKTPESRERARIYHRDYYHKQKPAPAEPCETSLTCVIK